jgi:hypothetical protein
MKNIMKQIFLIILICFTISCFSQQKNIIGMYSGYCYRSDGMYYPILVHRYYPKEHGFTICTNYERLLKNN